jgi:hypothetical protein
MIRKTDVISALNQAQVKVLEIYHPDNREDTLYYFAVNKFVTAKGMGDWHIVNGADITEIVKTDSLSVQQMNKNQRDDMIITKIMDLMKQEKYFSSGYEYVWHISS